MLVTFTDHVFTRDEVAGDLAASAFPNCSRTPRGYLCPDRYRLSSQLPGLISGLASQRVWNLTGEDRYAQVPIVDDQGVRRLYAIVFSLDRLKGLATDLRLTVRSAHICDRKPPDTFGEVRFSHLVKLRLERKHPKREYGGNRKRPKMP